VDIHKIYHIRVDELTRVYFVSSKSEETLAVVHTMKTSLALFAAAFVQAEALAVTWFVTLSSSEALFGGSGIQ
jgi:hypothetical protein